MADYDSEIELHYFVRVWTQCMVSLAERALEESAAEGRTWFRTEEARRKLMS